MNGCDCSRWAIRLYELLNEIIQAIVKIPNPIILWSLSKNSPVWMTAVLIVAPNHP